MQTYNRLQLRLKQPVYFTDIQCTLFIALHHVFDPYKGLIVAKEIIGPYVADFCIYPARVSVTVGQSAENREAYLKARGIRSVCVPKVDIERDALQVANAVLALCDSLELSA